MLKGRIQSQEKPCRSTKDMPEIYQVSYRLMAIHRLKEMGQFQKFSLLTNGIHSIERGIPHQRDDKNSEVELVEEVGQSRFCGGVLTGYIGIMAAFLYM